MRCRAQAIQEYRERYDTLNFTAHQRDLLEVRVSFLFAQAFAQWLPNHFKKTKKGYIAKNGGELYSLDRLTVLFACEIN